MASLSSGLDAASKKRDFFDSRSQTEEHKRRIIAPHSVTDLDTLYTSAFAHHVVDRALRTAATSGPISAQRMTELFHTEFLKLNIYRGPLGTGQPVSIQEFFEGISESPIRQDTIIEPKRIGPNKLSVLIGRVGRGKSTLISQIIVRFRKELSAKRLIPILIDVETLAGEDASKEIFFKELYLRLYTHLSSIRTIDEVELQLIWNQHEPQFVSQSPETRSRQYAVACRQFIIDLYHEAKQRLLLFVDNIDKYYYLFDRGGFSPEGDAQRLHAMEKLASIIGEFRSPDGGLDGAGMNVLVCIRRHTLDYLDVRRGVAPGRSLSADEAGSNIFQIHRSDPREVINSRVNLLKLGIERMRINVDRSQALDKLREMVKVLDRFEAGRFEGAEPKARSMLSDLSRLTSHGHRALIEHFASYRWAFSEPAVLRRFFSTYSPAIMTFMLDNRLRYSQFYSRFPNLFLVRGDLERPGEANVPERLVQPHRQTYWLKFLLCQYIFMKGQRGQEARPSDILDIFSPDEGGDGCFERHIVELALGSLSQSNVSAVIEPVFMPTSDSQRLSIGDIRLTERGQFLMEAYSMHFSYLQLIVEDYMLEFPKLIFDEFRYEKIDYAYFSASHSDYTGATIDHVNHKSRWVFLFLEMLESSLTYEIQRRPRTFAALASQGWLAANFDESRRSTMGGISAVAHKVDKSELVVRAQANLSFARQKRRDLDAFFEEAYIKHDL